MDDTHGSQHGSAHPLISGYRLELFSPPCRPGAATWSARASLDAEIDTVLPYLNARLEGAEYDHTAKVLVWKEGGHKYAFRSREIKAGPVRDREEACSLIDRAVALANRTWDERETSQPCYEKRSIPNLMEIYRLLPRTNCGQCGCETCMAFAAALREGEAEPACCPLLEQSAYGEQRRALLEKLNPF